MLSSQYKSDKTFKSFIRNTLLLKVIKRTQNNFITVKWGAFFFFCFFYSCWSNSYHFMIFCFSPPDFKHHVQLDCALMMNGDVIEMRYSVGTAGSRGVIDNTCAFSRWGPWLQAGKCGLNKCRSQEDDSCHPCVLAVHWHTWWKNTQPAVHPRRSLK